ncbi:sensor histidine kinase [Clostridium tunisiense]|uniref:sensor histidine kinase n=1 Tax=Clostridium tunisiense TaxID=219748 RepID=UPI0003008A89|nr:HAMP domain-containing sensor histidine kinase [Clostridium tunisiense]
MVKNSLFTKMVITYTVIISISLTIIAAFLSYWIQDYFIKNRKDQLNNQVSIIEGLANEYLQGGIPYEELNGSIRFISGYINDDILLIDKSGYVYVATSNKFKPFIGKQLFVQQLETLSQGSYFELISSNYDNFFLHEKFYVLGEPIKGQNGQFNGAAIINVSMSTLNKSLNNVFKIIWVSTVIAVIASSIVIYYSIKKIIVTPISEMNVVARKIAAGDVNKRVVVQSHDEIGEFAESFNVMADSLEKVEQNRKEFISNVSHELRSPITSIKGFIGGILDGVIPKEKEEYYLKIAYEEIQRLTRLINELLDLSAVESGKFKLQMKALDINEVVRLCILRNEARVKDKKLNVQVFFEEDELVAMADEDKIMQVITNLLDNAIKYADEGGLVTISCKSKGKKAFISIFNEGPAIQEEDIKYIWDRFYKGDKSRTQKVSTGLGLSIVKKIITLFDEEIWVENKENGVMFTFTLSLGKKL